MRYFHPGFVVVPPVIATWNNNDKSSGIDLTNGLLTATRNGTGDAAVRSTVKRVTGKYYAELSFPSVAGANGGGGFANAAAVLENIGGSVSGAVIQFKSGNVYKNGSVQFSNGNISGGGILRVAYDGGGHLVWLAFAGGNWNANAAYSPDAGTGGMDVSAFDSGGLYPCFCTNFSGDACTLNAGASSFTYSLPSGYTKWNG